MDGLVVVSRPEEGDLSIWHKLAKHVKRGISALIERSYPMLSSNTTTCWPIGIACNITRSVHILDICLKEWVTNNTTIFGEFDSSVFEELSCWFNSGP